MVCMVGIFLSFVGFHQFLNSGSNHQSKTAMSLVIKPSFRLFFVPIVVLYSLNVEFDMKQTYLFKFKN